MVSPAGDNFARWNFTKVNTDLRIGKETIINASSLWGANFRGWPVECQKRYMQELYVKTYTWQSEKPESAQNLTKSLAPTHAPFSGSDTGLAVATKQTMTYALTSSSKPPGLPGDTNTGYVGYLPGPDQGGPSFPDDISAHFDAANDGVDKRGPKLGRGVPKNLKDLVLRLAAFGKCREVFEQLLQTSSKKYEDWKERSTKNRKSIIETIYDSLKSVEIDPLRSGEGVNASGRVYVGNYNNDPRGVEFDRQRFALITLQETMHQVFDDDKLQDASEKLYNSGKLDPSVKSRVDMMTKDKKGKLYEHAVLAAACGMTDAEVKDFWRSSH